MSKITCEELLDWQNHKEFTLLDVRLRAVKETQPPSIARAVWRDPELIESWLPDLPDRPIVVFCAHGRSVSQGITSQLSQAGFTAFYLEGGLAGWQEQGHIVIA